MKKSGDAVTPAMTLDLTGTKCPLTFARIRVALEWTETGQVLELVLAPGEQMRTVPASLKAEGHRVTGVARDGVRFRLMVRKDGS